VCGSGSAGGIGAESVGATEGTGGVGKPGVFVEAAQTCGRQCEGTTGHASSGDGTTHVGGSNCERRTGQEAELGGVSGPAWGWRAWPGVISGEAGVRNETAGTGERGRDEGLQRGGDCG